MKGFNYKKAVQSLNFLASLSKGSMNSMKALKLVWFADRLHLRKYSRPITNDIYYAMKFGPVASGSRDLIGQNGLSEDELAYRNQFIDNSPDNKYFYISLNDVDTTVFSESELELLRWSYETFGGMSHFEISKFSHHYPEWKKFEGEFGGEKSRFKMSYEDFFLQADIPNDPFGNVSELALNYAREAYLEEKAIEETL